MGSVIHFFPLQDAHIVEEEEKRTNQLARMAIEELAENGKKLGRTVRRTIKRMVDGEQITKEIIENDLGITLKQHGQAVLRACENAIARSSRLGPLQNRGYALLDCARYFLSILKSFISSTLEHFFPVE